MIETTNVTGMILCGGAGARLEGRDKPLEPLGGRPLVAHVLLRLRPQVGRVLISCNRNFDAYGRLNDAIVADQTADVGPLAGVLAGMLNADTDYLFVCPGDAPFLSTTLVARLTTALCRDASDIAYPSDGERSQHLFALLRCSLAAKLRAHLDSGGRSVHGFFEQQRTAIVDAAFERDAFFNVNRPTDLDTAARILQQDPLHRPTE